MMQEIGVSLHEARLRRGIDLAEVEQAIKIRVKYLQALEEDAWELLPSPAYVPGFLRTYANFLGLDGDALVLEYTRRQRPAEQPAQAEAPAPQAARPERRRIRSTAAILGGIAVAGALAVLVILGLTNGSGGGGHRRGAAPGGATRPAKTSLTTAPTRRPTLASVSLRSIGTVWVCLVDDRGRALVKGLTLTAGESRGPYRAGAFEVTLGNGQVTMNVDGKPFQVPQVAEPLGYRLTPGGVRPLDPAARPTCT
jgi:cytoskeleton protein RodZ